VVLQLKAKNRKIHINKPIKHVLQRSLAMHAASCYFAPCCNVIYSSGMLLRNAEYIQLKSFRRMLLMLQWMLCVLIVVVRNFFSLCMSKDSMIYVVDVFMLRHFSCLTQSRNVEAESRERFAPGCNLNSDDS
jgi:hypothetical protein